jgi:hypothetical protein
MMRAASNIDRYIHTYVTTLLRYIHRYVTTLLFITVAM